MKLKWIALAILACAMSAQAQERVDHREQSVVNEDGGQSYLVLPATAPMVAVKPGAMGLGDLQQHSVFLGSGWTDQSLRKREYALGNLLLNVPKHPEFEELLAAGIKIYSPTWSVEKPDVAANRTISDLEIQNILSQMLGDGPAPTADSLFIVFLDPTLHSTLGPLVAEKHYIAYHGFFNSEGTKVHYVVVPFQSDSKEAYQIALRALIVAALHTDETPH